ncbi:Sirt6 [Symbiodinium sp. CCMP2456]|nr:Sirt6 [Symbiodinium sp. CCMP2456]
MAEATVRELINFGFSEDRAREAVENIGDVSDVQLAINWLLDHGEEDKGGAVEFKHCPHICELPLGTIVKKAALEFGNPCAKGCKGSENWVCLMCGVTHCGRYVNKHALHHWRETREADSRALTVGSSRAVICLSCRSKPADTCVAHAIVTAMSELGFLMLVAGLCSSGADLTWQWTSQRGTSEWDYATALQLDAESDIVVAGDVAGSFSNTTHFGANDVFLMKFNSSGTWQWTSQRGSKKSDNARALQIDPLGSIFVAGYTMSSLDGNVHQGGSDLFVSKYSKDGSWLWTRQRGSNDWDYGRALQLDRSGHIYMAGYTGGSLDGNRNAGGYDFFVMKLDPSGSWLWTRQHGSAFWDYARALRLDARGNVLVAGYTRGDLDGNENAGGKDVFLAKFGVDGVWQWTRQQGSIADDDAFDLGTDVAGNIFITGETSGALHGESAGSSDIFLMKFSEDGAWQWSRQRGTEKFDVAWALEVDYLDNILVAGYTGGSLDAHDTAGSSDVFVMMFDPFGSWQWTEQRGTPLWDYARALRVNPAGDVFLAGSTQGQPDNGNFSGGEDLFVMKFKRSNISDPEQLFGASGYVQYSGLTRPTSKAKAARKIMVGKGHFLAMGLMDLSVWCYACESYVDHEVLGPLVARMQRLKFGGADEEEPEPEVGSILDADPQSAHGFLGDPNWPLPRLASACNEEARPGYKTMKAHEYLDEPAVLKAKVKLLADLIARSRNCIAYTGAGISTASGIKDYATKASSSSSSSSAKSPWLAEPSYAHHVLVALWKSGSLKHWVQQNHDGLPQKAGFPQKDINEIHGAWWDPSNPVVPMDGTLRSDLIQWMLDWESRADLCLALGTSMVGMNADRMAVSPAKRAQRLRRDEALGTVIVALQQTQYDKISSLRIFARLDDVLRELASLLNLDVASGPVLSQRRQEAIIPYGRDGRKSTTAQLHLDLRVGSKLRVVDQPDWDQAKYGELCQVMEAPEELAKQGHVQLLFPGDGLKKSVTRFLGGWWIEAAIKGELDKIPVACLSARSTRTSLPTCPTAHMKPAAHIITVFWQVFGGVLCCVTSSGCIVRSCLPSNAACCRGPRVLIVSRTIRTTISSSAFHHWWLHLSFRHTQAADG